MIVSDYQRDVLQELVNIGMGKAAASLNQMASSHVELDAPRVDILSPQEFTGCQVDCDVIRLVFQGELHGQCALMLSRDHSEILAGHLLGRHGLSRSCLDNEALCKDVLREVANVLLIHLLGSMSNVLRLSLSYEPLEYHEGLGCMLPDKGGGAEASPSCESSTDVAAPGEADGLLVITTLFRLEDAKAEGQVLTLFPADQFAALLQAINQLTI